MKDGAPKFLLAFVLAAVLLALACSDSNEQATLMRDFPAPLTAPYELAPALRELAMDRADSLVLQNWLTQRSNPPDSLSSWLKKNYWALQSLGLRLAEQVILLQGFDQTQTAQAQIDTVKQIAFDFARLADDRLLLSFSTFITQLNDTTKLTRADLTLQRLFARSLLRQNKSAEALRAFQNLRAQTSAIGDPVLEVQAAQGVLDAYAQQDRYGQVDSLGTALVQLAQARGYHWAAAQTLNIMADAYRARDRDALALQCAQQAFALAQRLADRRTMRDSHFYRARILYRRDRLREAEAALEAMKRLNDENDFLPDVLLLEGQMHHEQGEYGLAQTDLEQAAGLFERSGDPANAAIVSSSLSLLHLETGDYQRALADERKAYAWYAREQSVSRMARSQMNLGFIFAKRDSLAQAQTAYRTALAFFRASGELRGVVETKLLQGALSRQHEQLPEAERQFFAAATEAQALDFVLGHARACLNLAALALEQGRFAATDSLLAATETMATEINNPALKTEAHWQRAQLAKQQAEPRLALSHLEHALALQEKMFGSIKRDSLRVSYFATVQDFFDEAVILSLALSEHERALNFAERGRARALLEAWGEGFADSARALLGRIPTVGEVQKSLPRSTRVIVYRVLPHALVAWLISPDEFVTMILPITRAALEDSAQKFLRSIGASDLPAFRQRVTANSAAVYAENRAWGKKFYELLLAPFAKSFAAEHELYVIPDGVLHQLPFGALVNARNLFVEEENVVLKAPSLAALYHGARMPQSVAPLAHNRLLYAGNPAGDLPAAALELSNVAASFARRKVLTLNNARFDTITASLQEGAEVFHLSLHAVADPQHALNSYLELSRAEATKLRPSTERIYARRLLEWELSRTWLVLLNGCETATGQVVRGEGVLNLARLFALQRVSVVIASLWKNDDRWSVALVSAFYRHLATGASPQTALHRAKLETIKKLAEETNVKYPLPYFWSVLELYLNRAVTVQQ